MKGLFLFPPSFDPSMPYLAPYLLSSFVNEHFNEDISEVLDLNVIFYNKICENGYKYYDDNADVSSTIESFYQIEERMEQDMEQFSSDFGIKLSRQSLLYNFDRLNSKEVSNYLKENSIFSQFLIEIFNSNVELKKYDFIGINMSCQDQLIPGLILAKYIKEYTKIKVILGGNIVSRVFDGLTTPLFLHYYDFIIVKEGEYGVCNIIRLLMGLELEEGFKSNSIYSSNHNCIIDKCNKSNIVDINLMPIPKFDCSMFSEYFAPVTVLPVFFSRGCSWGKCNFCGIHSSWCSGYRTKTVQTFCDELEYYICNYGCTHFRLIDESPSINDIVSISNEIIKRGLKVNIEAYSNISRKLLDLDIVNIISKAGFKQLFFGIESVSAEVLTDMNKNINDPKIFDKILNNTFNCGIHNYAFFLVGYPTDNEKNENSLKNFIVNTDSLGTISISSFIPVKGTEIVENNDKFKGNKMAYFSKGDLSNKCNYTINEVDVSENIKIRAKKMIEEIMTRRTDLKISSKLPYETRFFMCSHFGNDFGKRYCPTSKNWINSRLSKEQEVRALRPE